MSLKLIIDSAMGTLDPSTTDATTAKIGIDTTRPLGYFASTLSLSEESIERAGGAAEDGNDLLGSSGAPVRNPRRVDPGLFDDRIVGLLGSLKSFVKLCGGRVLILLYIL